MAPRPLILYCREQEINIFSQDEQQCGLLADALTPSCSDTNMASDDNTSKDVRKTHRKARYLIQYIPIYYIVMD